jgi:hypothetical protein
LQGTQSRHTKANLAKELKMPTHSPPTPADEYLHHLFDTSAIYLCSTPKPTHHPIVGHLHSGQIISGSEITTGGCKVGTDVIFDSSLVLRRLQLFIRLIGCKSLFLL